MRSIVKKHIENWKTKDGILKDGENKF